VTTIQRIWRFKDRLIKLTASKCKDCGFTTYPPKSACPKCGSKNVEILQLPRRGKVVSYTILNVPIKGFDAPLIIALIKLNDVVVMSEIINVDPKDIKVGMEVEATIAPSARTLDGAIPYVVKFKPITLRK